MLTDTEFSPYSPTGKLFTSSMKITSLRVHSSSSRRPLSPLPSSSVPRARGRLLRLWEVEPESEQVEEAGDGGGGMSSRSVFSLASRLLPLPLWKKKRGLLCFQMITILVLKAEQPWDFLVGIEKYVSEKSFSRWVMGNKESFDSC